VAYLKCSTCDNLTKLKSMIYCKMIPSEKTKNIVTPSGGKYGTLIIENPKEFGCLLHSDLNIYEKNKIEKIRKRNKNKNK